MAVRQGHLSRTRTKEIAGHQSTNHHLLNIYALHNYQYIKLALPPHLHVYEAYEFGDVRQLRRRAAAQIRQMKKSKTAAEGGDEGVIVDSAMALPSFQQNIPKTKSTKVITRSKNTHTVSNSQSPFIHFTAPAAT